MAAPEAFQVKMRRTDFRDELRPEVLLSGESVANGRVAIVQAEGGGFLLIWLGKRIDRRIMAQRYGFEWRPVGGPFKVNTMDAEHEGAIAARLANGNIAIAWTAVLSRVGDVLAGGDLRFQILVHSA